MKKLIFIFVLLLLLVGCGETQIYKNLTYQDNLEIKGDRDMTVYIFTNENGDKVPLYDGMKSSIKNLLIKGQKYDVEVSIGDKFSLADYIFGINKSK